MADDADKASVDEVQIIKVGLAKIPDYTTGAGSAYCAECGDPIPDARRKAVPNTTLCIECAKGGFWA